MVLSQLHRSQQYNALVLGLVLVLSNLLSMGNPGQHKGYGYIEYETRQSTEVIPLKNIFMYILQIHHDN